MARRRELLIALGAGAFVAPFAGFAQQQKIYRIGYLANDPDRTSPTFQAFIGALRELGWIEGKNIAIRYLTPFDCSNSAARPGRRSLLPSAKRASMAKFLPSK